MSSGEKRPAGKRVVLIGHCGPDSSYLRMAITSAEHGAQVVSVGGEEELQRLLKEGVDLLLLNRTLDYGFAEEEGVALMRRLRRERPGLKMMLVSNYPEAQAAALAEGALAGFGKSELGSTRVVEVLRSALTQ